MSSTVYLSAFIAFIASVSALNVPIALSPPSGAPTLSPSLISLSIEQDRWTDWAGTTSDNQFFYNALDNLKILSGEPPHIRIGADSEDHTAFDANVQFSTAVFPAVTSTVPYPEATNITVGNSYYLLASHLPPGTHVIWGLNLGSDNLTNAFLEAKSISAAFASPAVRGADIVLDYFEIGNEADLYRNNGLRSSSYTVAQYTSEWITFATNVSTALGLSVTHGPKFIGAAFAGSSLTTTGFSPQGIFNAGILQSEPGPLIASISQHHYSGSFCSGSGGLLQDLMTKSTIRSNLSEFTPDITATHQNGLEYVLGETNSYSCHGAPGVSNTAGAALWTLDYSLFASQIGISRLFFHEGVGYKYNLIQPITLTRSILDGTPLSAPLAAHVQPQYYAAIIAAEAIGTNGFTQAVELVIDNARISGYAFYEGGRLARAVIINSQAFLTGATNRTSIHIDLDFIGNGLKPTDMAVKRLAIGHADDASGLKWGGQTYETSDARPSGTPSIVNSAVGGGLDIQATEVVLLSFT